MDRASAEQAEPAWSWDSYEAEHGAVSLEARRLESLPVVHGNARRASGGTLSRFVGGSHHAQREEAALSVDHPALRERRSMFPKSVTPAETSPRLLVSGHNSSKLGAIVRRGPWRGMPIYHLTLEERATCPDSCQLWRECFGNAMPFTRRHAHGEALEDRLASELFVLSKAHPAGFVVRLHGLGDFYSAEYALGWRWALDLLPALRVFGYTAHEAASPIGEIITASNAAHPDRCCIRFSVAADAPPAPHQVSTVWHQARGRQGDSVVCPQQSGDTAACATCGLCWHQNARHLRILFIGHGMRRRGTRATNEGGTNG